MNKIEKLNQVRSELIIELLQEKSVQEKLIIQAQKQIKRIDNQLNEINSIDTHFSCNKTFNNF